MATSRAEATAEAEVKIPTPVLAAPLAGDTVPFQVEESVADPEERAMLLDARPFLSVWRLLQTGLGMAVLLLAVATLWLRRRQSR
jgi:hypothetical protein